MPISASSDPYDTTPGFEPASSTAKPFTDDLKEFDDDAEEGGNDGDNDGGKVIGDDADEGEGVATSKVDPTEIDDDLARAGTGAGADPIDLAGIEKAVPPDGADDGAGDDFGKGAAAKVGDDDDLDRAGTGAATKLGADADLDGELDGLDSDLDGDFVKGADAEADDLDDGFAAKGDDLDDDSLGADPSLKGAVDGDDFDEPDFVKDGPDDTDDADDADDIDGPDDKGDFLPFS